MEVSALAAAGEVTQARQVIDRLVAPLPPGPERVGVLVERFHIEDRVDDDGEAELLSALEEAAGDQRMRAYVLDVLAWHRGVKRGRVEQGVTTARMALAIAEDVGDSDLWLRAATHLGHLCMVAGHPEVQLMTRVSELAAAGNRPGLGVRPQALVAKHRLWAGDLEGSRQMLEQELATIAARGSQLERPYLLCAARTS